MKKLLGVLMILVMMMCAGSALADDDHPVGGYRPISDAHSTITVASDSGNISTTSLTPFLTSCTTGQAINWEISTNCESYQFILANHQERGNGKFITLYAVNGTPDHPAEPSYYLMEPGVYYACIVDLTTDYG